MDSATTGTAYGHSSQIPVEYQYANPALFFGYNKLKKKN
jgi:hypothetical protein